MRRLTIPFLILALALATTAHAAGPTTYSSFRSGNWSSMNGTTGPWYNSGTNWMSQYPWKPMPISSLSSGLNGVIRVNFTTYANPQWGSGTGAYIFNATSEANYPGGNTGSPTVSKRWVAWGPGSSSGGDGGSYIDLMLPYASNVVGGGATCTRVSDSYASAIKVSTFNNYAAQLTLTGLGGGTTGNWAAGQKVTITNCNSSVNGTWMVALQGVSGSDAFVVLGPAYTDATYSSGGTIVRDDQVTIKNTHTVTADVSVTAGDDAPVAPSAAITINAGGVLTINNGTILGSRGNILVNGTLTLKNGSTLQMGASNTAGASVPITGSGLIQTSNTSAGNRAVIGQVAGSLYGWRVYSDQIIGTPIFTMSYATITSGTPGPSYNFLFPSPANLTFDHVIFDRCSSFGSGNNPLNPGGSALSWTNCTWKNTVGSPIVFGTTTDLTTGTRTVSHCVFDTGVTMAAGMKGWTINDCMITGAVDNPSGYNIASFQRNLVITGAGSPTNGIPGDMYDCYLLNTDRNGNAMMMSNGSVGARASATISRCVMDLPFLAASGGNVPDMFYIYDTLTPVNYYYTYNLLLPVAIGADNDTAGAYNARGTTGGGMLSTNGLPSGNVKIYLNHNTYCANLTGAVTGTTFGPASAFGVWTGEYANHVAVNSINQLSNNLCWDGKNSGVVGATTSEGAPLTVNSLNPAGTYNNAYWTFTKGGGAGTSAGTYYNVSCSGTVPGANDVTLTSSPGFVDNTRSFVTWARTLASATTTNTGTSGAYLNGIADVNAALAMMGKMNDDTGFDSRYTISALTAWVRAGWAPTNTQLLAKASDGTTPGAIAGKFPVLPIFQLLQRHMRIGLIFDGSRTQRSRPRRKAG